MPDEFPNDEPALPDPPQRRSASSAGSRRKGLTPEQRRLLGTPRIREEEVELESAAHPATERAEEEAEIRSSPSERAAADAQSGREMPRVTRAEEAEAPEEYDERRPSPKEGRTPGSTMQSNQRPGRRSELQKAILLVGALVFLGVIFYAGRKFEYLKYQLFSARRAPTLADGAKDRFPDLSAEELVSSALAAERAGKIQEAVERLLAAKHKDLRYRGILFRVGKLAYDHGDFDSADKLLERAIAFGEDVDKSNYYRGLIAVRRRDLASAQRSFEAAAAAAPFVAEYPFYLGEAMRMDHHPHEAIPHYQHSAALASDEQDATLCQFKIRMARLEAAEASKVREEIEAQRRIGNLSIGWLLTEAALNIREGHVKEAVPLINQAKAAGDLVLFAACTNDLFFVNAVAKHPLLAELCRVDPSPAPVKTN